MSGNFRTIATRLALGVSSAAVAGALLAGCGQAAPQGGYTLTDGQVDVNDKTLTVTLDVDHAAGFEWDEKVEGDGLTFDSVTHGEGEEGATDTFTFTGTGAGEQTVTLTCTGETDSDEKTVTVDTKTNDSGQIVETRATGSDGSSGSTQL